MRTIDECKERALKFDAYRTWMYTKVDGEMKSIVVTMEEAEELHKQGWKLSPASFHEEYSQNPQFKVMADDVAAKMNLLVNLDQIKDKKVLIELGGFLNLKLKRNMTVKNMKFQINEAAELEKEGL